MYHVFVRMMVVGQEIANKKLNSLLNIWLTLSSHIQDKQQMNTYPTPIVEIRCH